MIGIPIEIQKRMKDKYGNDERIGNIIYNLMTHLHQPYSEIMNMPIPVAIAMLKRLEKEHKEMEKQSKKK